MPLKQYGDDNDPNYLRNLLNGVKKTGVPYKAATPLSGGVNPGHGVSQGQASAAAAAAGITNMNRYGIVPQNIQHQIPQSAPAPLPKGQHANAMGGFNLGQGFAPWFGKAPAIAKPVAPAPAEQAALENFVGQGNNDTGQQQQHTAAFGKTLADYIKEFAANDGGVSSAYGQQRQQAQSDFDRGNTDLGAMYAALANSLRASNTENASRQQQFQDMSKQATAANAGVMTDAYKDSRDATQNEANALGIGDFQSQAAKTGQEYNDLGQATNAAYGQTAQQQLLGNAQAQDFQGTENVSAAQFGGVRAQAALAANLQKYLGQLGSEEAAARATQQSQNNSLAQQAYQADYGQFTDQRNYDTGRDDNAWSRGMDQAKMDASATATPTYKGTQGAMQYLQSDPSMPRETRDAILAAILKAGGTTLPGQGVNAAAYKLIEDQVNRGNIDPAYANAAYQAAAIAASTKLN